MTPWSPRSLTIATGGRRRRPARNALSGRATLRHQPNQAAGAVNFDQIGRRLTEDLNAKGRRRRLLLMLDEFPALGRLDFFESPHWPSWRLWPQELSDRAILARALGSDKLKANGAAQELKGDAQKATGDAKNAIKDAANKTASAVNKKL